MAGEAQSRGELFHGWKLVGALSVTLFFAAGGAMYVFPVFVGSFQEEFGWSMTQISIGAAVFAIVMGFSNPIVGVLFSRFGARNTMLVAACLLALCTLAYSVLTSLWMLYGILLVSGFAVAGTTILPAQTLVTNWFNRFRGRAMGLTMLGIGAGGFLLPSLNELMIRLLGWRLTWVVSGLILVVIVIPLIAIFVRTRPSDIGLLPDGANAANAGGEALAATTGLPMRRAVGSLTFWLLVAVFLLQLTGVSALNFHFVPFATQEFGFTPQQATFFYGLTVGFSIVGRLLSGWMGDRWGPLPVLVVSLLLLALGPAVIELLFVRLGLRDANLFWLYAVPFGIGIGGNAVIMPVLVSRCFGELHFSQIMGLLMSGFAVGIIVGIPVAGWIFDETGSYELVLILCALALCVATSLAALIRPERHHAEFVTAEQMG